MRQFLERLLDRLSNKDKAKSTLWMVGAAIFLAISGTIGIILLVCVPSSGGDSTPGFSTFSAPVSSSPSLPPSTGTPVDHTSTLRFTAYVAMGVVVVASVAYCGTQLGFLLARRRTVRRLHRAIKSTDLEAALAKLAHAPQIKPARSLSADRSFPMATSHRNEIGQAPGQADESTAAEPNSLPTQPAANIEMGANQDVGVIMANWLKQRAAQSNASS